MDSPGTFRVRDNIMRGDQVWVARGIYVVRRRFDETRLIINLAAKTITLVEG